MAHPVTVGAVWYELVTVDEDDEDLSTATLIEARILSPDYKNNLVTSTTVSLGDANHNLSAGIIQVRLSATTTQELADWKPIERNGSAAAVLQLSVTIPAGVLAYQENVVVVRGHFN